MGIYCIYSENERKRPGSHERDVAGAWVWIANIWQLRLRQFRHWNVTVLLSSLWALLFVNALPALISFHFLSLLLTSHSNYTSFTLSNLLPLFFVSFLIFRLLDFEYYLCFVNFICFFFLNVNFCGFFFLLNLDLECNYI